MSFPKDHWLHNAKAGELHKKLGVPNGAKIPTKVLLKAAGGGKMEQKGAENGQKNVLGDKTAC